MIENAILKLTWFIFIKGPLNLIASFKSVIEYLTGGVITDLLFGSGNKFDWNNMPMQFWFFVIFAFCLFALVFTIQIIILIFKDATETKTKFVIAMQNGLKAFIFMFLIPMFFFLTNYIIQNIAQTISNSFRNGANLADYLWHMGNSSWNGIPDGSHNHYSSPSGPEIRKYNLIAQIFGTYFMLFGMASMGLALVQKIFELFFLFVISPIVMVVMVIDNGKAALSWKDMVIAKFLASTATLTGYYIFISAINVLFASHFSSLHGDGRSLFMILSVCGGSIATVSFTDLVAGLVGESIGTKGGLASMRSTMQSGFQAIGAGKMVQGATNFMRKKRAESKSDKSAAKMKGNTGDANSKSKGLNFSKFNNVRGKVVKTTMIGGVAGIAALGGIGGVAIGGYLGNKLGKKVQKWMKNGDNQEKTKQTKNND